MGRLISDKYKAWEEECSQRFNQLKANEEELNRIFIEIYGLQDELTPEVEDKDITVRKADLQREIKSLISYLIGIEFGRYSLDVEGLVYAGGDWDSTKYVTYQPDEDGIVPIYSKLGMQDGMTVRLINLIKLVYGDDTYRQNIDFIAEALGKKQNEASEETLNRYICDDFYFDHLKIYQKRPIYWMFSSGKNSGFKCLIYMHRYNEDTVARINAKYFLPESTRLKNELEEMAVAVESGEGRDKIRLEKERLKIAAAYNEAIEYGQILDHIANQYIKIDLDDGVKVNYEKFQNIEIVTDSGAKVKKNLLVPIK
ncbi:BREX-1 system adenine-specific DNA-methyltransferase PglX [Pumilibacter muris]|uniref:BREX-1 system adenine-specific DNA-methyltransferase PglX n=1 Tax=Pumilibacter muris TaxID=2941510 RepID=UPI00203E6D48|nr:BREX-1 system adenine-specific DNA-methyltransferase PglX [Pumilibacter muris]